MSHNAPQTGSMTQAKAANALYLRIRGAAPFAMRSMPDLSLSAVNVGGGQLGLLMRIASVFSFVILSAATLPAQAQDLPEHTVLAFNLTSCPKGWVEFAPAAGAFVVGVGDAFQLGRGGAGPANVTVADASGSSAKKSNVAGLLFCERNKNRR
jgi:hypothetical protein